MNLRLGIQMNGLGINMMMEAELLRRQQDICRIQTREAAEKCNSQYYLPLTTKNLVTVYTLI
jgi:hypothetical protein